MIMASNAQNTKIVKINYDSYYQIIKNLNKMEQQYIKVLVQLNKLLRDEKSFIGKSANAFHDKISKLKDKYLNEIRVIGATAKTVEQYIKEQATLMGPQNQYRTLIVEKLSDTDYNYIFNNLINDYNQNRNYVNLIISRHTFSGNNPLKNYNYDPNQTYQSGSSTYQTLDMLNEAKKQDQIDNYNCLLETVDYLRSFESKTQQIWKEISAVTKNNINPIIENDERLWAKNYQNWYSDHNMQFVYEVEKATVEIGKGIYQGTVGDLYDIYSGIEKLMQLYWIEQHGTAAQKAEFKDDLSLSRTFLKNLDIVGKRLGKEWKRNPLEAFWDVTIETLKSMYKSVETDIKEQGVCYALSHALTSVVVAENVLTISSESAIAKNVTKTLNTYQKATKTLKTIKKYLQPEELIISALKSLSKEEAAIALMKNVAPQMTFEEFTKTKLYATYQKVFNPKTLLQGQIKQANLTVLNKGVFKDFKNAKEVYSKMMNQNTALKNADKIIKELGKNGVEELKADKLVKNAADRAKEKNKEEERIKQQAKREQQKHENK